MIEKILLKDVASYNGTGVTLNQLKKILFMEIMVQGKPLYQN